MTTLLRRVTLLLALAGSLAPIATAALDLAPSAQCFRLADGRMRCVINGIVHIDGIPIETLSGESLAASEPSGPRHVPYERIVTQPDGSQCVTTGWRAVTDESVPDALYQIPDREIGNIFAQYEPCPEEPGTAISPRTIAIRHWETIALPAPKPHIAPGWGITGKLAYLETNGTTTHTHTSPTPLGELRIEATGVYHVDWGDGEKSGPHRREGAPWPNGTITHDYIWAGTYDVVVTQQWTATWRIGPHSGVLHELRTTGRIDDFEVRQIQAVIVAR
jgi:hypothetical protein